MGAVYLQKELITKRGEWKLNGKKVVFTNGVFDIVHRGHVEYLLSAKKLGDILIVAINSDTSTKKIKGPLRPIVPENDRAFIISQLICVDAVCLFNEETPFNIISLILPDVLVKGADYTLDSIVGRDIVEKSGGTVRTIDLVPNTSTTNVVDTIVNRFSPKK